MRSVFVIVAIGLTACAVHDETPARMPHDARAGLAPAGVATAKLCGSWKSAVGEVDPFAARHVSFPELDAKACFIPVWYKSENDVRPGTIPEGCGYSPAPVRPTIEAEASRYEAIANGDEHDLPLELACELPRGARARAAAQNARTLRALLARPAETHAYSVVSSFGYGRAEHGESPLVSWRPGDACPARDDIDMHLFGVNVLRATRAALAYAGGVAPVVSFSGGAIHSGLVEAFLMTYIATCRIGVPIDRVLVDPCANHTHTNVRNSGRFVVALGGRTGYIVTDDWLQGGYLQEWTVFDTLGGSIDQRALRDWGYLIGAWRQASVGIRGGFWFTPYRFWSDPSLQTTSCVTPPPKVTP